MEVQVQNQILQFNLYFGPELRWDKIDRNNHMDQLMKREVRKINILNLEVSNLKLKFNSFTILSYELSKIIF